MNVGEVMTRQVEKVARGETTESAAKKMAEKGVGCLVVVDGERPVGVITERDLVRKVMARSSIPSKIGIEQVMSSPPITISPGDSLESASRLMILHNIRRLVVTDGGRLAGIITATDLAKSMMGRPGEGDRLLAAVARYHKEGY